MAFLQSVSNGIRELALFAGGGGGILGAKLLGWHTVCAVEIDSFRAERLAQRQNEGFLPPFPIWNGGVEFFDGRPWRGAVDLVSCGFPCQDISLANPNAVGIAGARSGLWKEGARIIREAGPELVWLENSPALVSRGLEVVLTDLAEMGFDAVWGVLGAVHLGGFHKRERFFLLGYTDSSRLSERLGFQGDFRPQFSAAQRADGCALADDHPQRFGSACRAAIEEGSRSRSGEDGKLSAGREGFGSSALADSGQLHARRSIGPGPEEGRRSPSGAPGCGDTLADANGIPGEAGLREDCAKHAGENEENGMEYPGGLGDCLWTDRIFLHCKDGKYRATKPGICGVAHGMADRLDRVSAIGDGQVPAVVASAFEILAGAAMSL